MPRYSVIAADTLRDNVTLTFDLFDFGQWSYMAGHVANPPPSLKILRLSVLELWVLTSYIGYHCQERAGHLEARFHGEGVVPLPTYWWHSKGNWMLYNLAADSFYIMKLCSRLFVLHCEGRPKYDNSRHFDPHFEEVRGSVEPWSMTRWKAPAEFLLSVIELLFLSLTVQALQGKTCQNSQPSVVGRSLWAKNSGGRGRPWGIFFGFYKTRHILIFNVANCTLLRAVVWTQYRRVTDRRTDRQTDRLADRRNCCS